ncbi:aminopeptidase [Candidatus Woesearchaeota archaeon]|nr:aminopeptidase [Candidatus Woesearchaeota archaeon]
MSAALVAAAKTVLKTCMGLKAGESVLIIYDKPKATIAKALWKKARSFGNPAKLYKIPIGKVNGQEPPRDAAAAMLVYDIVILTTSVSYSHTHAREQATKKGVRIASMPGITTDIMSRMGADYQIIKELTNRIADTLDKGKQVRITTKKGTDLTFSMKGRIAHGRKGGIFHEKGFWGNLPEGEAFIAPVEGTANGVYIVDASQAGLGKVKELRLLVRKGYVTQITGDGAQKLARMLASVGKYGRNIAEFGIGTNGKAKICGITLEDEKVLGTCHLALGNNFGFGGAVDVKLHLDGVMKKPTIYIDETLLMKEGVLQL